jgi:predicted Rossmann-fold nucleotide-binding protein
MNAEFWEDMLSFLRSRLAASGKIEEGDIEKFIVTDSPEEAVAVMRDAATNRFGFRYTGKPPRRRRWLFE